MVHSSKGQHEDFDDDEEVGTHKGKSREKNRTKHSETEQRRRSKINERFQMLRDLIPQNDQKRDKASFLLEVIEYVQFLQERLNMYEGSYQNWSSEPRKLIPWKNDHSAVSIEGIADPGQLMKNDLPNNVVVSPSMLHNPQNSLDSEIGSSIAYKTLDQTAQINAQQSNVFDPIGSHAVRESGSDIVSVDPLPQVNPESWHGGHSQEEKIGSVCVSNSYSQGVLDTLTQTLQSSGADMSQTSVSVQINVATRTSRPTSTSASKIMASSQATDATDKYEQAHKRVRIEQ